MPHRPPYQVVHHSGVARIPVFYTFGNHQHWVDLQWLWGYHVMPNSIWDMLGFCEETGAKGCVNFDGIGYEKLAAENPEALAALREAIADGTIEPVGCSYGQPYGLFHGGESNIRHRIYGVRTAMRVLGKRPRTFWEEEFDFFPQLPQLLRGCGFDYASLYFQWTWHTPEVPKEDVPVVWWEGPDGSRLLTATRNKLNLHQWPEDFDGLLDELAKAPGNPQVPPLILQWLELMPTPDWMCRAEVLLPRMKELISDERFEIRFATLGEYLRQWTGLDASIPTRKYSLDQVWHGMSLGKNWDYAPRLSAYVEQELLASEALAATLSLFGRPYANWDAYPTWEFEEAWRYLLAFQHHDNHECEGLCGHAAQALVDLSARLAQSDRSASHLVHSVLATSGTVIMNSLGWPVTHASFEPAGEERQLTEVGAFGYAMAGAGPAKGFERRTWAIDGDRAFYHGPDLTVEVELSSGSLLKLATPEYSLDFSPDDEVFPCLIWRQGAKDHVSGEATTYTLEDPSVLRLLCEPDARFRIEFRLCQDAPALEMGIAIDEEGLEPDPGMNSGIQLSFGNPFPREKLVADSPLLSGSVRPTPKGLRKYPKGDWMTSPQWFEEIENAFTAFSFVDFGREDGSGVLVSHGGSQQWFLDPERARCLLHMADPWDEEWKRNVGAASFRMTPHGPLSSSERRRRAAESREVFWDYRRPVREAEIPSTPKPHVPRRLPNAFCPLRLESPSVMPTAFYRETEDFSGMHLERYAGRGMGYPFVLRLVEYDGEPAEVDLVIAGPIDKAFKTNLMGEIETELTPEELASGELANRPLEASQEELDRFGIRPQRLRFSMRPHEVATLYLDIVPGRKQYRNLDAKREVWATVHRVGT